MSQETVQRLEDAYMRGFRFAINNKEKVEFAPSMINTAFARGYRAGLIVLTEQEDHARTWARVRVREVLGV